MDTNNKIQITRTKSPIKKYKIKNTNNKKQIKNKIQITKSQNHKISKSEISKDGRIYCSYCWQTKCWKEYFFQSTIRRTESDCRRYEWGDQGAPVWDC